MTAALALTGHDAEASEALMRYMSLPDIRAKTIGAFRMQTVSANPTYLATRERVYDGLRKAGMPEQ